MIWVQSGRQVRGQQRVLKGICWEREVWYRRDAGWSCHNMASSFRAKTTALNRSISSPSAVSIIRMWNNTVNWLMTVGSLSRKGPLIAVDMAFIDPALVRINKVCCSHSLLSDLLICVSSLMTDECVWGAAWSDNGFMCVCVCVMRSPDQQCCDCCWFKALLRAVNGLILGEREVAPGAGPYLTACGCSLPGLPDHPNFLS